MPCALPIPAVRSPVGGRVSLSAVDVGVLAREYGDGLADEVLARKNLLFLPCGSCVGCQLSRARSWAVRCSLELSIHSRCCFVTLTYRDADLPPTLSRHHLSLFRRALAKRVPGVRYFGCGEYGDWFGRPHYHALLFGTEDEQAVVDSWGRGFATAAPVNPARIAYTAGYCAKKVGLFGGPDEVMATRDSAEYVRGELVPYQGPFLQMSRRPGIGGHAREFWRSWRTEAVWQNARVPVPRFLHSSWQEAASETEKAELLLERAERRMVPTIYELRSSDAMARKRVELNSDRREL